MIIKNLNDTENLPINLAVHPERDHQGDVADLAGPTALEHDAVEVNVIRSADCARPRSSQ